MKLIFTDSNRFAVFNMKNILAQAGIECFVKNDIISSGAGELPPTEVWPELWLLNPLDAEKAKHIMEQNREANSGHTSWFCQSCSEANGAAFDYCWQCGKERH